MKKIYIIPETHMVNLNLLNSVLGGEPGIGKLSQGAAGGDEPGFGDAKGNDEVVDDDDLGYSPIQTDWSTE
ncbi:MAG: hypothetical protein VZR36_10365 [Prevotella sp.]|jgi:hypothetical protein|nr:hypothetical protein [Prevotella sp.]